MKRIIGLLALGLATAAQAQSLGTVATANGATGDGQGFTCASLPPVQATVGAGVEWASTAWTQNPGATPCRYFNIDVSSNNEITISSAMSTALNAFGFTTIRVVFNNATTSLLGVQLVDSANMFTNTGPSSLPPLINATASGNTFLFSLAESRAGGANHNYGIQQGGFLRYQLQTATTNVPEPASLALLGLGLAGLGLGYRRKA